MKERLVLFLDYENLSPAKFADAINVQRSSISHILAGRNKPSFDFIQKTLTVFPYLNADWLITGKGQMIEGDQTTADLFSAHKTGSEEQTGSTSEKDKDPVKISLNIDNQENKESVLNIMSHNEKGNVDKCIERVIVLYSDKSFAVYNPEK